MELIVRLLPGIIASVCMEKSISRLLSPPPSWWRRALLYLPLTAAIALPSWVGDENPILLFPFFLLGFLVLLPGEKLPKLIIAGIFYTLLISLNMIIDSLYWRNSMQLVAIVCKPLAWCPFAWLLWRIVPEGGLRLSRRLWALVGGLTLAPLVSMLSFSIWGNIFQTEEQYQFYEVILKRFGFTVLPFVMVSALTLLLAMVVLSRHEALEQENQLAALREIYYTSLRHEQTQLRILRHDLRNHVAAIQGLLEQGKQAETQQYLQMLADSPALSGGGQYSNNDTANVVLSSKAAQMEMLGLHPDFEVALPAMLSISAPELCALLGNALDNAIEGAMGANKKAITLRTRLEKGVFMLQVQNAVGSQVKPDLSTTKADAAQHGLGLAGMREIALRHGGSLETVVQNGCFELLICFPCQGQ